MVRLKVLCLYMLRLGEVLFQFQYGAIKRILHSTHKCNFLIRSKIGKGKEENPPSLQLSFLLYISLQTMPANTAVLCH